MIELLKVKTTSKPNLVAAAIANILKSQQKLNIQAVGAGSINQAVKALAITRGFVAPNGIDLVVIPAFSEITIDGEERTAIRFIVESR